MLGYKEGKLPGWDGTSIYLRNIGVPFQNVQHGLPRHPNTYRQSTFPSAIAPPAVSSAPLNSGATVLCSANNPVFLSIRSCCLEGIPLLFLWPEMGETGTMPIPNHQLKEKQNLRKEVNRSARHEARSYFSLRLETQGITRKRLGLVGSSPLGQTLSFLYFHLRGLKLVIKTLAIFTELSKPKLLRAEFYLSPLLQEIEEPALIKKEFLQHFKNFLGTADRSALVALMTADDVKKTIFLKANKAQGPDGFTAEFFQSSWSIVGKIVTKAILEFLSSFKPTASRLSSM
ncbi:unnamed protein product [Vicia faba]|uniref:Uncharacterized protein n=1 Tax=Vicia faba TaxID=3906 RepID=A0AAV1A8L2_VICFA|nr:unnamed protein product [Vicia faba]